MARYCSYYVQHCTMQLCARVATDCGVSVAAIILRYQRQLNVADSAGRMIDPAKRPLEAYQMRVLQSGARIAVDLAPALLERAFAKIV